MKARGTWRVNEHEGMKPRSFELKNIINCKFACWIFSANYMKAITCKNWKKVLAYCGVHVFLCATLLACTLFSTHVAKPTQMGTFVSTINWTRSKKLTRLVLISYVHFTIYMHFHYLYILTDTDTPNKYVCSKARRQTERERELQNFLTE